MLLSQRACARCKNVAPQPGPGPGQSLAQDDAGNAERACGLLRGQPGQVDELERGTLGLGQLRGVLNQLPAGALSVDPRRELLDLVVVERPVRPQPRGRIASVGGIGTMARVDMARDPEQLRLSGAHTRIRQFAGRYR